MDFICSSWPNLQQLAVRVAEENFYHWQGLGDVSGLFVSSNTLMNNLLSNVP